MTNVLPSFMFDAGATAGLGYYCEAAQRCHTFEQPFIIGFLATRERSDWQLGVAYGLGLGAALQSDRMIQTRAGYDPAEEVIPL